MCIRPFDRIDRIPVNKENYEQIDAAGARTITRGPAAS